MGDQIRILLADLVHPGNQFKTFPYAAGCVGAYAAEQLGDAVTIEVFRSPEALGAAMTSGPAPAIVGFTNYVWNHELSYEVLRRAKAAFPNTVMVMGGPNYPTDAAGQRAFLARYAQVDFYVYKEGEVPFVALLEALREVDLDGAALRRTRRSIASVHYLGGDELIAPPPGPRVRALDEFPSPYLTGLLDGFFGTELTPVLQTQRGCPFQCTFCVEGESYYTKVSSFSTARVREELEYIASRMGGGSPVLHIADSNFGMYTHDLEVCDVVAEMRQRFGWPETVEVSTGKNKKERVLEAVRRTNGAMRFGPALQTTDAQTLVNIKRANISERALIEMASAATDLDQRSYTELILGLPGETIASHERSIAASMEAGLQRIKMYPLALLPGTEMAGQAARDEFGLQTRFRVLPLCHGTYEFLGERFPSVEISELVIATHSMSFAEYLAAKRFELSVEIFYNDIYLEEIHGLMRGLGLPMIDFVRRCHARFEQFPAELQALYAALEHGVRDNLWASRDACLAHHRDPANLERYAREEYKNSLGTLKAIALLEHIEAILVIARAALDECLAAARPDSPGLAEYVDELLRYSWLRRRDPLAHDLQPEARFGFAFDRIMEQGFRVDPSQFKLVQPRTMRFWHDADQVRDLDALRAESPNAVLLARSFIYPRSDPGLNPYLRRARFC